MIINKISEKFQKYLLVGAWNTIFGYFLYSFFVFILNNKFPHSYIAASVISNFLAVTQAFLLYKFIVFKTKGKFLEEYIKFMGTYTTLLAINIPLLPIFVFFSKIILPSAHSSLSPYLGGLLLTGITVIVSFFMHRHITFKHN